MLNNVADVLRQESGLLTVRSAAVFVRVIQPELQDSSVDEISSAIRATLAISPTTKYLENEEFANVVKLHCEDESKQDPSLLERLRVALNAAQIEELCLVQKRNLEEAAFDEFRETKNHEDEEFASIVSRFHQVARLSDLKTRVSLELEKARGANKTAATSNVAKLESSRVVELKRVHDEKKHHQSESSLAEQELRERITDTHAQLLVFQNQAQLASALFGTSVKATMEEYETTLRGTVVSTNNRWNKWDARLTALEDRLIDTGRKLFLQSLSDFDTHGHRGTLQEHKLGDFDYLRIPYSKDNKLLPFLPLMDPENFSTSRSSAAPEEATLYDSLRAVYRGACTSDKGLTFVEFREFVNRYGLEVCGAVELLFAEMTGFHPRDVIQHADKDIIAMNFDAFCCGLSSIAADMNPSSALSEKQQLLELYRRKLSYTSDPTEAVSKPRVSLREAGHIPSLLEAYICELRVVLNDLARVFASLHGCSAEPTFEGGGIYAHHVCKALGILYVLVDQWSLSKDLSADEQVILEKKGVRLRAKTDFQEPQRTQEATSSTRAIRALLASTKPTNGLNKSLRAVVGLFHRVFPSMAVSEVFDDIVFCLHKIVVASFSLTDKLPSAASDTIVSPDQPFESPVGFPVFVALCVAYGELRAQGKSGSEEQVRMSVVATLSAVSAAAVGK